MYQPAVNFQQILSLIDQLPQDEKSRLGEVLRKQDDEIVVKKWQDLITNPQKFDKSHSLSNEEIDRICQYLVEHNQNRPIIKPQQKIGVPDNFNDPLPDDILNSFYQ